MERRFPNHKLKNSTTVGLFMSAGVTERDQSPIFKSLAFLVIEEFMAQ